MFINRLIINNKNVCLIYYTMVPELYLQPPNATIPDNLFPNPKTPQALAPMIHVDHFPVAHKPGYTSSAVSIISASDIQLSVPSLTPKVPLLQKMLHPKDQAPFSTCPLNSTDADAWLFVSSSLPSLLAYVLTLMAPKTCSTIAATTVAANVACPSLTICSHPSGVQVKTRFSNRVCSVGDLAKADMLSEEAEVESWGGVTRC